MGNLLGRAFGLTISLEEKSRYYAMYGIGANYWKNKWLNFPVICCIILDMIISLYLALQMQSYSLPNVLFHLLIFPMVYSAWDFTYFNYYTRPRNEYHREAVCYVFFINIFFSVPFCVIKILLLSMYIPDISTEILSSPLTPLSFLIIWALISFPFIIKYQVIFGLFYWVTFSFVLILLCLTFPGYWFRRRYPFYVLTKERLLELMTNLGSESPEIIDDHGIIHEFLTKNTISDEEVGDIEGEKESPICYICRCELRTDLYIVKLTCQHKFHSACLERLFAQKFPCKCPNCNKSIELNQRSLYISDTYISERDKQKSIVTKLHYYLLLFSHRPSKYYPMDYLTRRSSDIRARTCKKYIILRTLELTILPFIAGFTDQQSICVLSNSFIFLIVFQVSTYLAMEDFLTTEDLNFIWTDNKMIYCETDVCANLLYQFSLLWNVFMLILSLFIIISISDTFAISEYLFLGFLIYKGFLDVFFHCALVHVFCTLIAIIFDIFVVFPVTVHQMIVKKKPFYQVWLRY